MNRKIPFHELASLLAANCNISSEEAEEFIKSFFDLTTQALSEGES
ncbi:HU family DNA-binding protein, partial [uncultured Duncaniella sp.]